MKLIRMKLAIPAILCCSGLALASYADQLPVRNCTWYHGASAQGYTPAPRLAGQRPRYLNNQLIDFRRHARDAPFSKQYMWGAAANLSPGTARDLAAYFSGLPPQPANDGERQLVASGRAIYQEGIPDDNVAACAACHGPDAQGIGEIPRLGGLAYSYLTRRLQQWGAGFHATAKPPMPRIAGKLSTEQIEAIASYLSFVR